MPITHFTYGKFLSNGTVFLALGATEGSAEITCTREWALDFAKKITAALDEQTEAELQTPAPSAPFQAGDLRVSSPDGIQAV
jgi:hypothetical protein